MGEILISFMSSYFMYLTPILLYYAGEFHERSPQQFQYSTRHRTRDLKTYFRILPNPRLPEGPGHILCGNAVTRHVAEVMLVAMT